MLMKGRTLMKNGIIVFALLLGLVACKQDSQVKQAESAVARATFVTGQVTLHRGEADQALNVGDMLQQGDRISTAASATAEVFIKGQGIVRLSESTEMTLASLQENMKTKIDLKSGSSAFFLRKMDRAGEFTVQSPTAVAGVRGTAFMMSVQSSTESHVALYDGSIAVKNDKGKEVILSEPGELAIHSGQDISDKAVRPLSKESLNALKKIAVFQRSTIMEYNSILDDMKSNEVMKGIEINGSTDDKVAKLQDETARPERGEKVRRADENTIKRDTKKDPLKIEPNKTF